MDSIQREFGNDLQILLTNVQSEEHGDDEQKIRKSLDLVETRTGLPLNLPVIANNPWLDQSFPSRSVPQEVWIDSNGVVLAITGSEQVTRGNISAYLEGRPLVMKQKNDLFDFSTRVPLFVKGNGGNGDNFLARSLLTPFVDGIGYKSYQVFDSTTGRFTFLNTSLRKLLLTAYPVQMSVPESQQELKGEKANRMILPASFPTPDELSYCYELIIPVIKDPAATEKDMIRYLQQDLDRTFGLTVKVVRKELECWSLTSTPKTSKSFTKQGEPMRDLIPSSKRKFIQNLGMTEVVQILGTYLSIPLLNDTRLKTNIDIELPFFPEDEQATLQCLRDAGFRLQKVKRTLPVTVITMN
ncbi:MAG: DUF3738 domain-containing protein [Chitinophagaceae bacterium]|nr:MAG: DUF3738 domain-containing protein [Chitinophagaceae bacterium]